ncbi:GMC oxidoreductase [Plenodomus tracheiphilus IPT5]|uniref:GMC oxidoreductase n=1 Tax=Plenodomus tracheiphilus IPT5 TaxID=1408161 RepID=A0A6A7B955_9PLEO|nr:GMC oxidoreductase [Plenodomus tracheiphilus IPT5]
MLLYLALFYLLQLTAATCSPTTYDFLIIGGGPAGLIVANRLSANPNVTVAVIEAGDSALSNPNVTTVPKSLLEYGQGFSTSIEWGYRTAPQKYTSNKTLPYWAGRGLGGSTLINGMTYLRAEKAQIDAWENLGNEGWNWENIYEGYYRAQEGFQTPSEEQQRDGASYEMDAHGTSGQLDVAFTPYLQGQNAFQIISGTTRALGIPLNLEANDGLMRGTNTWPMTLNISGPSREDAARAWIYPIVDLRPNLHVFLNTTATRIVWDDVRSSPAGIVAKAVEVITPANVTKNLHARREVIISAGSIRSPALLEHSGVGNAALLESLGIKTILSHPTVGSNLQDQPANGIVYASSTNWTGYPTFVTYLTASDLFGADLSSIAAELRSNLSAYVAVIVADYAQDGFTPKMQEQLLKHQLDLVFTPSSTVPLAEILWAPTGTSIIAQFWNLLPFSRGSIHIASENPLVPPKINPNFLQLPIDVYVEAAIGIRVREFFATAPLSEHVTAEVTPGFDIVPANASWRSESWAQWIKESYGGNSHPVSTCAMMSEELGGVVNKDGQLYGAKNVRIVDASVFPTQISGHLSATVYAIAGRIADAIQKRPWSEK